MFDINGFLFNVSNDFITTLLTGCFPLFTVPSEERGQTVTSPLAYSNPSRSKTYDAYYMLPQTLASIHSDTSFDSMLKAHSLALFL